jgi:hypothetical protein
MPFEALLDYSRRTGDVLFNRRRPETVLGFAPSVGTGQVYNERAFRYFLALERKRAERSNRSLVLLLVNFQHDRDARAGMRSALANRVFSGLAESVREIDFVGWYREGQIAGAVLAQGADAPAPGVTAAIVERVTRTVHDRLPSGVAARLQVRALQVRRRAAAAC